MGSATSPFFAFPRTLVVTLLIVFFKARQSEAETSCETPADCVPLFGLGSICLEDGTCQADNGKNPFENGCLHQLKPGWKRMRVCNSEDSKNVDASEQCQVPNTSDPIELRIFSQSWESAMLEAWIVQIVLSEIVDVPATIETGIADAKLNFYDPEARFGYGSSLAMEDAFQNAARFGQDCRLASRSPDNYQPCANFLPEMWDPQADWIVKNVENNIMERPVEMGVLGREGWFVPRFTAERQPSLLNYLGLQGEKNRQKLADTFLRPTKWKDYCNNLSPSNCSEPDDVSQRHPQDETEASYYYADGLYTGFFRKTEKNDCEKNPNTCTGHIVSWPCQLMDQAPAQVYHLNISLEGDGEEPNSRGYKYHEMQEIWKAANATRSDVIMLWYSPNTMFQSFQGTDSEFVRIGFPPPSQECIEHRVKQGDQCSDDFQTRVGDPRGVCDTPTVLLYKGITAGLVDAINDPRIPEAIRSPAYDVLDSFSISEFQIGEILGELSTKSPREAVCQWIVDNPQFVETLAPASSRIVIQEYTNKGLTQAAITLATTSTLLVLITGLWVYKDRNRRVIRFAQIDFLWLLLAGALAVAVGAIFTAVQPTDVTCTLGAWLIILGYTTELVPLIVKVAATNRLASAARRMRRVTLSRRSLYGTVKLISIFVILFLIMMTVFDPPRKTAQYTKTDRSTEDGDTIVEIASYCSSEQDFWGFIALGWNAALLFCAAVLAFQTRNVQQDFNESAQLAVVCYSQMVFLIIRLVSMRLAPAVDLALYWSVIYSIDTMATMVIYFVPKFLAKDSSGSNSSSYFNTLEPTLRQRNTQHGATHGLAVSWISNPSPITPFSRNSESKTNQAVVVSSVDPSHDAAQEGIIALNRVSPQHEEEEDNAEGSPSAMGSHPLATEDESMATIRLLQSTLSPPSRRDRQAIRRNSSPS